MKLLVRINGRRCRIRHVHDEMRKHPNQGNRICTQITLPLPANKIQRKRWSAIVICLLVLWPANRLWADDTALPAFPGAEGWGAGSVGGRGGRVIKVTNRKRRGAGSFYAACAARGPRIVVFDVSGVIEGDVAIKDSNITIAGQTAPGAGITLRGSIRSNRQLHDVVIRFLRIRPPRVDDAIQLPLIKYLILDHVTASWAGDETVDLYRSRYVTVQWCTIEESDWDPKTEHNAGLILGENAQPVSIHHNLFAHHRSRNPLVKHGPADVINNVVYNFRDGFTQYAAPPATGGFNIIGNYYKAGPSDPDIFPFNFNPQGEYYLQDNYIDGMGVIQDPWAEAYKHHGLLYYAKWGHKLEHPISGPPIRIHAPHEAYEQVLARAGCFPRDTVTKRTIREVRNRAGSWGRHEPPSLMEGLTPIQPLPDSDGDGMPDPWEIVNDLDPHTKNDTTPMPSGYTAIEQYLNELAQRRIAQYAPDVMPWSDPDKMPQPDNARIRLHGKFASLTPGSTNSDLKELSRIPTVETLHLPSTRITDSGLRYLAGFPNLRTLDLSDTTIGDTGLGHLSSLASLRALNLTGTSVTDAGLAQLKPLKGLMVLAVPRHISNTVLEELGQVMPDLRVTRAP